MFSIKKRDPSCQEGSETKNSGISGASEQGALDERGSMDQDLDVKGLPVRGFEPSNIRLHNDDSNYVAELGDYLGRLHQFLVTDGQENKERMESVFSQLQEVLKRLDACEREIALLFGFGSDNQGNSSSTCDDSEHELGSRSTALRQEVEWESISGYLLRDKSPLGCKCELFPPKALAYCEVCGKLFGQVRLEANSLERNSEGDIENDEDADFFL